MPNVYKRKTTRAIRTPPDVMERAEEKVRKGSSLRSAAEQFGIDKMTLSRYIRKRQTNPDAVTGYAAVAHAHFIFTNEMEEDLANHVKFLANMFYGLSLDKCCKLAFSFASRNNIKIPESWKENKKAGKMWWLGFKKRQKLSIRSPEATSLGRATAFNQHTVGEFYDNLAHVMDKYKIRAEDIYNLDETGCTTVQDPQNIIAEKGRKQVGSVTSGERGELVTVVYTVSANGNVIPPMFIFPRVHYRDHFIRGGPLGCIGQCSRSGWINEELFLVYLKHGIHQTRCTTERKILVILDNHESHISLCAIDEARANGVILLTIPPHTSHRLQPLDKAVFGSFKASYNRAMDGWLRSNPGKTVTIYDIPSLVNEAQLSAMSARNIISGFQSTGIYPYNRNIYTVADFTPAVLTDREIPDMNALETADIPLQPESTNATKDSPQPGTSQMSSLQPRNTSHLVDEGSRNDSVLKKLNETQSEISNSNPVTSPEASNYVSPGMIYQIPKAASRKAKRSRKKGKTMIITSTPIRNEIAEHKAYKKKKSTGTAKRNIFQEKESSAHGDDTSSFSDESIIEYDDSSDEDIFSDEIIEGDFVIVKVVGKGREVHFIARIDIVGEGEYEGVFLQKLSGRMNAEEDVRPTFIPNDNDEASFPATDILYKLPQPKVVGGSSRRSAQLRFNCNLSKWNIK